MINCPSVFISSTYADLKQARQCVREAILHSGCIPLGMEYFPASGDSQFEYIKKEINVCDCVVLIIADRYGTIAQDDKSFTEKEFDYAIEHHKHILAFIRNTSGNLSDEHLDAFRQKAMNNRLVKFWETEQELKGYVIQGLMRWKSNQEFLYENSLVDVVGWKTAQDVAKEIRLDSVVNVQLEELIDFVGDQSDWAPNYYLRRMSFWEIYLVLKPFLTLPRNDNEVNDYLSCFICENSEDAVGYGNEKVTSCDLLRIKLVLVAHHLISIDSSYRWKLSENCRA
jgi:hypothetical protein